MRSWNRISSLCYQKPRIRKIQMSLHDGVWKFSRFWNRNFKCHKTTEFHTPIELRVKTLRRNKKLERNEKSWDWNSGTNELKKEQRREIKSEELFFPPFQILSFSIFFWKNPVGVVLIIYVMSQWYTKSLKTSENWAVKPAVSSSQVILTKIPFLIRIMTLIAIW